MKGFSGGRLAALQIVLDGIVVESLSHVQLFGTPCTIAREAPLSMGFLGKNTGARCHALLQGIFQPKD